MKAKDILFLVAAIIAWLYSSYRSYQKQAGKKREAAEKIPTTEEVKPVPRPIATAKKVPEKAIIREKSKRNEAPVQKARTVLMEHSVKSKPAVIAIQGNLSEAEKKEDVHNIQQIDQKTMIAANSIEELIDEIHSEKIDWRKAVILNELIRPVYFI